MSEFLGDQVGTFLISLGLGFHHHSVELSWSGRRGFSSACLSRRISCFSGELDVCFMRLIELSSLYFALWLISRGLHPWHWHLLGVDVESGVKFWVCVAHTLY
ncbi:hypothetical protein M758_N023200 [Ceratodon purpureus]|uniref:Uncharacterized protein n=1 Tax=Ceratodon purpureus TaxID=3225 RepID=A0A8T0GHK2_CERPU|nr:hypothetical protein M758_N023200 [Ceratodon purpureus]KAG0558075.1 hypothetical protein KC19_10G002500 [Ceratodon purpureus]